MTTITRTAYVLSVRDLARSAAYYRDVLGFTIHEIGDDGWRWYVKDGCTIMAGEGRDETPAAELGDHSYFAYIWLDDVDAYYEAVRANGARILKPLRDEPWGTREFALQTIDGHRIMFGVVLATDS